MRNQPFYHPPWGKFGGLLVQVNLLYLATVQIFKVGLLMLSVKMCFMVIPSFTAGYLAAVSRLLASTEKKDIFFTSLPSDT